MTDARCRVCGRPNDHQHVGFGTADGVRPVVDLRSLPNAPDGVMGKGTPIDPAALDALADGKVSYADDT